MLVLAIETSTPRSSVCLAGRDGVVASAALGAPRRHAEFVAPAMAFCFEQAGVDARAVTGVVVGLGPGLYTGLRVGIAIGKAFAHARRLPVVGLCGLDALAFRYRHARRLLCAALDARRGELFWAFYRPVPGGVQRLTELRVGSPTKLGGEIQAVGEECLVVGEGGTRYAELLEDAGADVLSSRTGGLADRIAGACPDAADLAELAIPRFVREDTQRPDELLPLYLRVPDARIGWETRGRAHGGSAGAP